MPRVFRFKCRFKCKKCGHVQTKMGSCSPKLCPGCEKKHMQFEMIKRIDLKAKK